MGKTSDWFKNPKNRDAILQKLTADAVWVAFAAMVTGVWGMLTGAYGPYLFSFVLFSAGCALWLVRQIRGERSSASPPTPSEATELSIRFNRFLSSEWRRESGLQIEQKIVNTDDNEFPRALSLNIPKDQAVTYDFGFSRPIKRVTFVGKFTPDSVPYICMEAVDPNGAPCRRWFYVARGTRPAEPHDEFPQVEYKICVTPVQSSMEAMEHLPIDIKASFDDTFGSRGFELRGISGFRFRGPMTIAAIRMELPEGISRPT